MADFPVTGVFKKKANSLEAAWKIIEFYKQTAVPYQNFYVEEWEVNLIKTHYKDLT